MMQIAQIALIAAGALALTACGITGPAHTEPVPPAVDHVVTMGLTEFSPATLRIRAGETVQWRNSSPLRHTVTADPDMANDPANVRLPEGAEAFHSGDIAAGEVWQRSFGVVGTYQYVCLPHERQGMTGTIVVDPR
jgi:plastocyanin